jgi:hypothetical protein
MAVMMGVAMLAPAACNGIWGNEPGHLVDLTDAGALPVEATAPNEASLEDRADREDHAAPDGLDASDGGPDGPTDAGWSPAVLGPAVSLWLDGDRGLMTTACTSGTCVVIWGDQSGHGNNAFVNFEEATAPAVSPTTYSGHQALRFDGSSTSFTVADTPSLQASGACTVIAVAAEQRAFHVGGFYSKTGLDYPYEGIALWGSYTGGFPHGTAAVQVDINQFITSATGGLDDGKLHLFAAIFDGGQASLIVDDAPPEWVTVSVTPPFGAPGAAAFVGGNPLGGQVLVGDIAEVIVLTRGLDETEWAWMREYLGSKYYGVLFSGTP